MPADIFGFSHEGSEYAVVSFPLRRPSSFANLTAAELDVAEGVLEGLSVRDLAARRGVSERTIGNQLARIYRKLGISFRHELVVLVAQAPTHRRGE